MSEVDSSIQAIFSSQSTIRRVNFKVHGKGDYSIDVNDDLRMSDIKMLFNQAAKMTEGTYTLLYQGEEFPEDQDDYQFSTLFTEEDDPVIFEVKVNQKVVQEHEPLLAITSAKIPCTIHLDKITLFYCFTCRKAICLDCKENEHVNHEVKEKTDYVLPSKLLMEKIFKDAYNYIPDKNKDKIGEADSFSILMKNEIFVNLKSLVESMEKVCLDTIATFIKNASKIIWTTNFDQENLMQLSTNAFINLKNDIRFQKLVVDDNIYLNVDNKLKQINEFKEMRFTRNLQAYNTINSLFQPMKSVLEDMTKAAENGLKEILNRKNELMTYMDQFNKLAVDKTEQQELNELMFENLTVERLSLKKSKVYADEGRKSMNIDSKLVDEFQGRNATASVLENMKGRNSVNVDTNQNPFDYNYQFGNINEQMNILYNNSGLGSKRQKEEQNPFKEVTKTSKSRKLNSSSKKRGIRNMDELNEETQKSNLDVVIEETNNHLASKRSKSPSPLIQALNEQLHKDAQVVSNVVTELDINRVILMQPVINENKIRSVNDDGKNYEIVVDFIGEKNDIYNGRFKDGLAYCNHDKKLYVCGGEGINGQANNILIEVSSSNNKKFTARMLCPMNSSHTNHTMIAEGDYVYAIGGDQTLAVERYSISTNSWVVIASLREERSNCVPIIYNNYLYVFGGINRNGFISSVERLNLNVGTSKEIPSFENVSYGNEEVIELHFLGSAGFVDDSKVRFVGGLCGQNEFCHVGIFYDFDKNCFSTGGYEIRDNLEFIEPRMFFYGEKLIGMSKSGKALACDSEVFKDGNLSYTRI